MNEKIRRIAAVLAVLAASFLWQAAAEERKSSGAVGPDVRAEPYEDVDSPPSAAGGCCDGPVLVPVCRCVPTTKKKQKTEYDVKCELVCVPGCSSHLCGGRHQGCSDGCAAGCCDTPPCSRAKLRPKKTLIKKVVEEEEDAWEYKVEWVCAGCATGCCSPGACSTSPHPPSKHARAWHAFHDFWNGLFHRK